MTHTTWLTKLPKLDPPTARSLSLLFILQETLDFFSLLNHSKEHCQKSISSLLLPEELEEYLHLTIEDPSPKQEASLNKLSFYIDILLQASKLEGVCLLQKLEEIRHFVSKVKSHFFIAKRQSSPRKDLFETIHQALFSLHQTFQDLFSSLIPFLKEARTDENILLYLLEERNAFNQHLGIRMIEHLFQDFFPTGKAHLYAVIYEGFTRRGFSAFLHTKEYLIEEFQWETESEPQSALTI